MSATLDPRRREAARMAELDRLGAMRPEADRVLQELVDDTREVFGTGFCMVNLVTADEQFYKVWSGEMPPEVVAVRQAARERTMCRHVVEDERPFVVEDFFTSERFREQHLCMGTGIRFYAGTPLVTSGGHTIGSLCLVDGRPREFDERDSAMLRAFGRAVVGRLEVLGAAAREREAKESERQYRRNVFDLANDAILIYGTDTGLILDANRRACEMYGIPQEEFVGRDVAGLSFERESEEEHTREVLRQGAHRGFEAEHRRADGTRIHVSINSSVTEYGGQRAILSIVRDVTERKHVEQKLKETEERYRLLVEQIPAVAYIDRADVADVPFYTSPRIEALLGYTPEEWLEGRLWLERLHPDDRDWVLEADTRARSAEEPFGEEYRLMARDGRTVWVRDESELLRDEAGRPLLWQGVLLDITERKRAEEALRRSEERFRSLIQNAPDVIMVLDADNTILYDSPSIQRVLGYEPGERVGSRGLDYVHPEDLERAERTFAEVLTNPGIEAPVEYRLRHKDGSWRDFEATRTNLLDDPVVGGVVINCRDITRRKRTEEALRESEERYRLVARATNEVIWDNDLVTDKQEWNGAVRTMFGYSPQERGEEGRWWEDRLHPDDSRRVMSSLEALLEGDAEVWTQEYRFRRKDGAYATVVDRGYVVRDGAGRPVRMLGSMMDITERKRTEEALRESERRLSTLLSDTPAMVYRCLNEPDWPEEYVSDYALELTGYPASAYMENPTLFGSLISEKDRQRIWDEVQEAVDRGERFRLRYAIHHKDGTLRFVEEFGQGVYDESGRVVAVEGLIYDVTERERAEERLREAEERYRTLVERVPAIVYVQEPEEPSRTIYVSPQNEAILGYAPEECLADPEHWINIMHPDDRERVLAEDRRTNGCGDSFATEYRQFAKDGRLVWLRDEATLVRDEDGEPLYWLGVQTDVTERKRAEDRLRKTEERYRTLVERLPAVTFVDRADGSDESLYVSPQIEAMLGYTPEEWMAGHLWRERLHPEDRERLLASDERFEVRGEPVDEEYRLLAKDGSVVWVHEETVLVRDEAGEPRFVQGIMSDVTQKKRSEERLHHLAFHDPLTGLPNRRLFVDHLRHALQRTRRQGKRVAVLFMDLDQFKVVNDSLGHEVGDLLLTVVAQRLGRCLRSEDTLARFGGDEFVVLLEDIDDAAEVIRVAERITEELRRPFVLEERQLYAAASIGVSLSHARTHGPEGLLREADTAMYRAKDEGSGYEVFDPAMHERALGRLELENDLRRAIEEGEFVVHYQPIVNLQTGELWGMEALVRWEHPERGLLNPDEFVPVAEESGLVVPMGELVLEEACRRAVEWQREFPLTPPLAMSVNLSGKHLRRPDLHEVIGRALAETGLPASSLGLDVTETVYISALDVNTAALDRLRALGIRVSLDDFGSGYSSLSYLKRLPADILKIDRSFTRGLGLEVEDTAIVQTVVDLAHILGMEVVAEGVEIEEQLTLLKEMGCDFGQGYHFSRPLPPEEASEFLRSAFRDLSRRDGSDSLSDSL